MDIKDFKPKFINDDFIAYVNKTNVYLCFEESTVLLNEILGYSWGNSVISQKELFSLNEDCYSQSLVSSTLNFPKFTNSNFLTILLNTIDVSVLSSIVSCGFDYFIGSEITINKDFMQMKFFGIVYYLDYKIIKENDIHNGNEIKFSLDYFSLFYIYQLLKDLKKKENGKILFKASEDSRLTIISTEDFNVQILCNYNISKNKVLLEVETFLKTITFNESQELDRKAIRKESSSVFKHLTKCMDRMNLKSSESIDLYENDLIKLYITKAR